MRSTQRGMSTRILAPHFRRWWFTATGTHKPSLMCLKFWRYGYTVVSLIDDPVSQHLLWRCSILRSNCERSKQSKPWCAGRWVRNPKCSKTGYATEARLFFITLMSAVLSFYASDDLQIIVREQRRRQSILLRFTDRLCMTRLDDAWGEHPRACIRVVNWSLRLPCGLLIGCVWHIFQ